MPSLADLISLRGRRALVTGAASGIGEAIALRLAEAGAVALLVDLQADTMVNGAHAQVMGRTRR